jgi:hypothetical protein
MNIFNLDVLANIGLMTALCAWFLGMFGFLKGTTLWSMTLSNYHKYRKICIPLYVVGASIFVLHDLVHITSFAYFEIGFFVVGGILLKWMGIVTARFLKDEEEKNRGGSCPSFGRKGIKN